jgi:hypothetical protein
MLCTNFQPATDEPVVLLTAFAKISLANQEGIFRWRVVKRRDVNGVMSGKFIELDKYRSWQAAQEMANALNANRAYNMVYRVEPIGEV